jgi:hypothetical protein
LTTVKETRLTFLELAFMLGTRAMLGAGVALLISDRLTPSRRRLVSLAFGLVGVLTTIPAARMVLARPDETAADRSAPDDLEAD